MNYISPSVKCTAFNCPHCDALAKQQWFSSHADALAKDSLPLIFDEKTLAAMKFDETLEQEKIQKIKENFEKLATGRPFFKKSECYISYDVLNIWYSQCFNCNKIAVWIYDSLVYPVRGTAPAANPDMPESIKRDYQEASAILAKSPRGAAALIRLCIQQLCIELKQPGKNLNQDIGALVASGLDPRVQKALDAVRVIGNNAVHPGKINFSDDRGVAETLFKLLNLIVEKTISEPKHVEEVYASLPVSALEQINRRDGGENS